MNETRYTETEALTALREALTANGLWNWTAELDNRKSRAGACAYGPRTIFLSRAHVANNTRADVDQTIIHEVAHALTPDAGRGMAWRVKAWSLGYTGKSTMSGSEAAAMRSDSPWVGVCPGGHETTRYRAPRAGRVTSCGQCSKRFDERFVIVWSRRGFELAAEGAGVDPSVVVEPAWMESARVRGRALIAANLAERS